MKMMGMENESWKDNHLLRISREIMNHLMINMTISLKC